MGIPKANLRPDYPVARTMAFWMHASATANLGLANHMHEQSIQLAYVADNRDRGMLTSEPFATPDALAANNTKMLANRIAEGTAAATPGEKFPSTPSP